MVVEDAARSDSRNTSKSAMLCFGPDLLGMHGGRNSSVVVSFACVHVARFCRDSAASGRCRAQKSSKQATKQAAAKRLDDDYGSLIFAISRESVCGFFVCDRSVRIFGGRIVAMSRSSKAAKREWWVRRNVVLS